MRYRVRRQQKVGSPALARPEEVYKHYSEDIDLVAFLGSSCRRALKRCCVYD